VHLDALLLREDLGNGPVVELLHENEADLLGAASLGRQEMGEGEEAHAKKI